MTLSDVAETAGLSIPYVSNLERGHGNPTIEVLRSLAGALEVSLADLVGGDPADFDPMDAILASAPQSLSTFARSERFVAVLERLAKQHGMTDDAMRRRLLVGMASAPRRSAGEPTDEDWRRLLDVYSTILNEP